MKLQNMLTKVLTRGIRGVVVAGVASVFFASSPVLAKGGGSGVVTALNLYYATQEITQNKPQPRQRQPKVLRLPLT
ncbi:MAG: hypothetical protein IPK04_12920 [Bdellovibrionales bacterium]|nr:hypothetical protein [Bdellovibrionales bacterium]